MAGEVFRIEIPVHVRDQTNPGIDNATRRMTGFERSARRTKKQLDEMQATKWQLTLYALDKTHAVLTSARRNLMSITGRTWNISIGILGSPLRMLSGIKNSLFSLSTLLTGIASGFAVKKGFIDPLSMSNDFADARIGFRTMLGGPEQGDAFLQSLEDFAEHTPFTTAGLRDLSQRMIAFKFASKDVIPYLEAIGDWSGLMGRGEEGISRVTLALGQMKAKGRVQGDEMLQLTEAGINAYDYLSQAMGKSTSELMKLQEKGLIPADKAIDAIITGLKKDFGGGMKQQEETTRGLWNTLKETFDNKVVKRWGDGLSKGINPMLKAMVGGIDDNKSAMNRFGDSIERTGELVGKKIGNSIQWVKRQVSSLTNSDDWKNATTFGAKVGVTWDFLKGGFEEWWGQNSGIVAKTFESAGGFLGGTLKGGIMAALGLIDPTRKIDETSFEGAGQTAGAVFFKGFMEKLDLDTIAKELKQTTWNIIKPSEEKSTAANMAGISAAAIGGSILLSGAIGLGKKIFSGPIALGKGLKGALDIGRRWKGGGIDNPVKVGPSTPSVTNPKSLPTTSPSPTTVGPTITQSSTNPLSTAKLSTEAMPKGKGFLEMLKGIGRGAKALPWKGLVAGIPGFIVASIMDPVNDWMNENHISLRDYKEGTFGKGGGLEASGIASASNAEKVAEWARSSGILSFMDQLGESFIFSPKLWAERAKERNFRVSPDEIGEIPTQIKEETVIHINVTANQQNTMQSAATTNDVITAMQKSGDLLGNLLANRIADRLNESYSNRP